MLYLPEAYGSLGVDSKSRGNRVGLAAVGEGEWRTPEPLFGGGPGGTTAAENHYHY